ncbi:acyltransferase family protein [Methylobacterium sp. CM6246]
MKKRLDHLDGLRGLAAVVVVVFHLMSAVVPWLVPDQQNGAAWIAYSPIAVLWNGTFAVSVFFVLSGFVVTNATIQKSDPLWIDLIIRYLRLAVPATLSAFVGWALLSALPNAATELYQITGSRWLQWTYQGEIPSLLAAAYNGLIGIFVTGGSYFNNVLWTMRPELIGSIICFLICFFNNNIIRLIAATIFGIVALVSSHFEYECFVFGIYIREAWVSDRLPSAFPIPVLLIGLIIGSQSGDAASIIGLGWLPSALKPSGKGGLLYPIAATFVVYGCMRSASLVRFLSGSLGRFLGSVSFPLYLIHVPIIYTFFAKGYVMAEPSYFNILSILTVCMVLIFAISYILERYLERPYLVVLGRLRKKLREKANTVALPLS